MSSATKDEFGLFLKTVCDGILAAALNRITKEFGRLAIRPRDTAYLVGIAGSGHLRDKASVARYFRMGYQLPIEARHLRTVADQIVDHAGREFAKYLVADLKALGVQPTDDLFILGDRLKPPVGIAPSGTPNLIGADEVVIQFTPWLAVPRRLQNGLPVGKEYESQVIPDQGKEPVRELDKEQKRFVE